MTQVGTSLENKKFYYFYKNFWKSRDFTFFPLVYLATFDLFEYENKESFEITSNF